MDKNLHSLYVEFLEFYTHAKEAALVKKHLEIEKGLDPIVAQERYNITVERCDIKIEALNNFMYFVIKSLGGNSELSDYFNDNIIHIVKISKHP